jgi:hypothetical protein
MSKIKNSIQHSNNTDPAILDTVNALKEARRKLERGRERILNQQRDAEKYLTEAASLFKIAGDYENYRDIRVHKRGTFSFI